MTMTTEDRITQISAKEDQIRELIRINKNDEYEIQHSGRLSSIPVRYQALRELKSERKILYEVLKQMTGEEPPKEDESSPPAPKQSQKPDNGGTAGGDDEKLVTV